MAKAREQDPHIVIVRCNACGAKYSLEPVVWTEDGGYFSSDRDFCKECGSDNVRNQITWTHKECA